MQLRFEIPDSFWSLFRSVNRDTYIEALLVINEEYQYSNYFLTREICIQILSDLYTKKRIELKREENETEFDMLETPSQRILKWLLRAGWLKKMEDYHTLATNIVIPDYAAIFIEAFERLNSDEDETEIYIQNVYATLFSFRNDSRANISMLRTALVNTRRLNKALQDMLHNMDKFFGRLLEQKSYGELLREHLEGYVEEIVSKKYHILKTTDNFYIYKTDIKKCLREMREDEEWLEQIRERARVMGDAKEDVLELMELIERGFDDIEHRISNMDKEHTKYVRATVTRLNYLLSGETDTKGLVIQLLNRLSQANMQIHTTESFGRQGSGRESGEISAESETVNNRYSYEEMLRMTGARMNLSLLEMISEQSLYKRRKARKDFISQMAAEEESEDLKREDVLKLNRIQMRYSKKQIEDFIESHMHNEVMDAREISVTEEEAFEKLILAYDYSTRRNSKYKMIEDEPEMIENGQYRYPALKFVRRYP